MSLKVEAIAHIVSPFHEKFAIPRQPGLVQSLSCLVFEAPYNQAEAFDGLGEATHLWLQFVFDGHRPNDQAASPTLKPVIKVRPPRLGGNKKLGVFATRSSFRPNALGLSLVRLDSLEYYGPQKQYCRLWVEGADLLNNTAVLDVKPWLAYSDYPSSSTVSISCQAGQAVQVDQAVQDSQEHSFWASQKPDTSALKVDWNDKAVDQLCVIHSQHLPKFSCLFSSHMAQNLSRSCIDSLIALDPRPAYHKGSIESRSTEPSDTLQPLRSYGFKFCATNIVFEVKDGQAYVQACEWQDSLADDLDKALQMGRSF